MAFRRPYIRVDAFSRPFGISTRLRIMADGRFYGRRRKSCPARSVRGEEGGGERRPIASDSGRSREDDGGPRPTGMDDRGCPAVGRRGCGGQVAFDWCRGITEDEIGRRWIAHVDASGDEPEADRGRRAQQAEPRSSAGADLGNFTRRRKQSKRGRRWIAAKTLGGGRRIIVDQMPEEEPRKNP